MRTPLLHLAKLIFIALPETRAFRMKSSLLRFAGARLCYNVRICSSVLVVGSGDLSVGDDTWVGHQALISATSRITIGSSVDIGPRVYIGTGTHVIDSQGRHTAGIGISRDIVIGNGVWLGANCAVLPGVTIGEKSVVAAGAVVTENVPPLVVFGGVPAKFIRRI
jgi:acetyltransferase-like isoleucine patch superfamily enzyme